MSLNGDDDEEARPHLRYEGEDTSATTTRELNGWYAYPIAAEVFAVVAVGTSKKRKTPPYLPFFASNS
jgi:UMF1 family MFS transporter